MKIYDVMTPDPACCAVGDTAQTATIIMRELNVGIIPVVDSEENKKLIGVVTDRDLCMDVVAEGLDPADILLEACISTDLVSCHQEDEVSSVLELMKNNQVRRIPVVDDENRITGIVSTADMVLCGDIGSGDIDETIRDISEPTAEEFEHLAALADFEPNNGNRLLDADNPTE